MRLALTFLVMTIVGAVGHAASSSPFGGGYRRSGNVSPFERDEDPVREVVIVVGVGAALTLEQSAVVKSVWDEMKATHTYSEDGELEPNGGGQEMTSTPEIVGAFYRYISNHPVEKKGYEPERCTVCPGSGTIVVYEDVQRLRFTRQQCDACQGTGKRMVTVTYRIVCPVDRLPPKGRTPRQLKLDALVDQATAGDVKSRLELAKTYANGSQVVPRDEAKATELYHGLALEGNLDGFKGYADMLGQTAKTKSEKSYAAVIALACQEVTKGPSGSSGPSGVSYLDMLESQLLTSVAVEQFVRRRLDAKNRNMNTLIEGLNEKEHKGVRQLVAKQLKSRSVRYDQEAVQRLMGLAEGMDAEAFAVLGSICESGIADSVRLQSAYIYYRVAAQLNPSLGTQAMADRLAGSCDVAACAELLEVFGRFNIRGKCPRTFIESVYSIKEESR